MVRGSKHSKESKLKISIAKKGHPGSHCVPHSDTTKKRLSKTTKLSMTSERKKRMSDMMKGRYDGPNHPQWKGGKDFGNRHSYKHNVPLKEWRKRVFERDDYTCQVCYKKGCVLNAHHIAPFATFKDLRYNINNGITLCVKHHKAIHRRLKCEG